MKFPLNDSHTCTSQSSRSTKSKIFLEHQMKPLKLPVKRFSKSFLIDTKLTRLRTNSQNRKGISATLASRKKQRFSLITFENSLLISLQTQINTVSSFQSCFSLAASLIKIPNFIIRYFRFQTISSLFGEKSGFRRIEGVPRLSSFDTLWSLHSYISPNYIPLCTLAANSGSELSCRIFFF